MIGRNQRNLCKLRRSELSFVSVRPSLTQKTTRKTPVILVRSQAALRLIETELLTHAVLFTISNETLQSSVLQPGTMLPYYRRAKTL